MAEEPIAYFHEKPVTWTVEIQVPEGAEPGEYTVEGGIAYQTCTMTFCDRPTSASFSAKLTVTTSLTKETSEVGFTGSTYEEIAEQVAKAAPAEPERETDPSETKQQPATNFAIDDVDVSDSPTSGQRPAISMLLRTTSWGRT